ncbi:receptor-type tyrosine-protein phosphatase delta [Grus japonensis]|uniref:protein-tyrosine-phosphatase n=1 Tax=Grus japonensis TaxID=30415 RepID=A0ABC9Y2H3_GRUJA
MGPQLKVVERTRTATMLCAASGNPDPEITWFKDFLPVDTSNNNGRIKQLRSGALQIELSEESDQGKYECVATNSAGTRYSAPANLYVRVRRVPPRFSIPPTNHEIMPGGSVNITCVAVGSPMPYVKWMLGAEDLTPEDDMPIGRNVLELNDVRQSANYTCVAMSTLGVIEAIAQITVKALPKPPGTPVVTESTATSITLTWDSGNPEPVSYYIIQHKPKNSEEPYKEIDGVATTRYSVAGLSPYSEYEFRVVAVNNIGRGPPSEPVSTRTSEQAPSSAPRNVQARMLSSTTILVQWEEPEEPNGQIQGYRVYYTMDPTQHVNSWMKHNVADSHITTIGNLVPQKTYSVKVLAFTSVGDGPLSSDIQVITQTGDVLDVLVLARIELIFTRSQDSRGEWPYLESLAESTRGDSRSTPGVLESGIQRIQGCYTPTEKEILAAYEGVRAASEVIGTEAQLLLAPQLLVLGWMFKERAPSTHHATDATWSKWVALITQRAQIGNPNHPGILEVITDWPEDKDFGMSPEEVTRAEEAPPYNKLTEDEKPYALFTDGSCHIMGKHGRWKAAVWSPTQQVAEAAEGEGESSQFAEVKAIQLALDITEKEKWPMLYLYTDSWMVANALWGWLQQWKWSNWQRRGKRIWAAPLWQDIAAWLEKLVVKVHHVDAHVPKSRATEEHQNNHQVDQAAQIEVA